MTYTCTSAVGKFTFENHVPLSHAKLVRDAIVSQLLCPKSRTMVVETETEAYDFIRSYDSMVVAGIPFGLELNANVRLGSLETAIRKIAGGARWTGQQLNELAIQFDTTKTAILRMVAAARDSIPA